MARFEIEMTGTFENKVIERALECVTLNKVSMLIDEKAFGKMAVFIDQEPKDTLRVILGEENTPLEGKTIYVGT